MTEAGQRHLERIERAGADIAEHDTQRGQHQKCRTPSMMSERRRMIGGRMRGAGMRCRPVTGAQRGLGSIVHDDLDATRTNFPLRILHSRFGPSRFGPCSNSLWRYCVTLLLPCVINRAGR